MKAAFVLFVVCCVCFIVVRSVLFRQEERLYAGSALAREPEGSSVREVQR